MDDSLTVNVEFFAPFRVSSGTARPGVDSAVALDELLPASSLKGVMAAAARSIGVHSPLIDSVYGTPRSPGFWSWSSFDFNEPPVVADRTRIRIDEDTGTVVSGALLTSDEVWSTGGSFTIDRIGAMLPGDVDQHRQVLALSAGMVRSLGATRRRGFGWVSMSASALHLDGTSIGQLTGEATS